MTQANKERMRNGMIRTAKKLLPEYEVQACINKLKNDYPSATKSDIYHALTKANNSIQ